MLSSCHFFLLVCEPGVLTYLNFDSFTNLFERIYRRKLGRRHRQCSALMIIRAQILQSANTWWKGCLPKVHSVNPTYTLIRAIMLCSESLIYKPLYMHVYFDHGFIDFIENKSIIQTRKIAFPGENAVWMLRAEMPKHCWKNAEICRKMQLMATKKLMWKTALPMNLEATMQNGQKWCQNLHSTEKSRIW